MSEALVLSAVVVCTGGFCVPRGGVGGCAVDARFVMSGRSFQRSAGLCRVVMGSCATGWSLALGVKGLWMGSKVRVSSGKASLNGDVT